MDNPVTITLSRKDWLLIREAMQDGIGEYVSGVWLDEHEAAAKRFDAALSSGQEQF